MSWFRRMNHGVYMSRNKSAIHHPCQFCGKSFPEGELFPVPMIRAAIQDVIRREKTDWQNEGYICHADLNRFRTQYVEDILSTERGELSSLETEVLQSLRQHEAIASNVNLEFEQDTTFGNRLADRMASLGGSWRFLMGFSVVMILWISVNSVAALWRPFDPYPYILLNLALSCLAAIQAPVIMMSQNRQEAKDRLRSENDYRVNLKAELEIRQLHSKLDLLLTHQWQRLLEIQEIQLEVMAQISERK